MMRKAYEQRIQENVQRALKCHPTANREVLTFIYEFIEIHDRDGNFMGDAIIDNFSAGYCYYFALILKDAFGGEMMWVKGRGHVVWYDTVSQMVYDICGVYVPDISSDGSGEPVPLDLLKENLESFRHRGHDNDIADSIEFYCKATGISVNELTQKVCNDFPKEQRIFPEPNLGDLYRLWNEWFEDNTTQLEWLCIQALKQKTFIWEFAPDDVIFYVLADQMSELSTLVSKHWILRHPKSSGEVSATCSKTYYCELLNSDFRFEVTRHKENSYEVYVQHIISENQNETLHKLNQF